MSTSDELAPCLADALGHDRIAGVGLLPPAGVDDLAGWYRRLCARGVEFVAPGEVALLRVTERPSAPATGAIDRAVAALADRARATVDRVDGWTALGELASVAALDDDGAGAACARAWVLSDHAVIEIGAVGRRALAATLRQLVISVAHEVTFDGGPRRPRRFLYQPPAGWRAERRGLHTDYWPADGVGGPLTVAPAMPVDAHEARRWDRLLRGALLPDGDAHVVERELVHDDRRHVVRLETCAARAAAHEVVLDRLVASIRPSLRAPRQVDASAFAWLD